MTYTKPLTNVEKQLYSADDIATTASTKEGIEVSSGTEMGSTLGTRGVNVTAKLSGAGRTGTTTEIQEAYRQSKRDFLHRHILDYQSLFHQLSALSSGDSYLFLDDLYHMRRGDQPQVIDYFHRIAKGVVGLILLPAFIP